MNPFRWYRDKKAAKEREQESHLKQSQRDAEAELDGITAVMLSCPCAINDMRLCSKECVHWRKGHVSYFPPWYTNPEGGFYYAVRPKCRLWGDK